MLAIDINLFTTCYSTPIAGSLIRAIGRFSNLGVLDCNRMSISLSVSVFFSEVLQRYTYREIQTIQMKRIVLCLWADD